MVVATTDQLAGPMYEVANLRGWLHGHPGVDINVERYTIRGGPVSGLADPAGTFFLFDQRR